MPYTRKQVVTCISIVYLIFTTGLAGYAASRANRLSLPIPSALAGFTTLLPAIAGLLLEGGYDLNRVQERHNRIPKGETPRPPLVIVANTLILIYSTVVITLLGTYAAPASQLDCGLRGQWTTLFHNKDSESIRAIQESFKCCGLANSRDMAWPFPDKNHDARACENAFTRANGCMRFWKAEEQRIAGILMTAVGLVFLWQMAIIFTPTKRDSWLHRIAPESISRILADEEQGGPDLEYVVGFHRRDSYRDDVVEEVSDDEGDVTQPRTIEAAATQQIKDVFNGEGRESGEQTPTLENEWARN